GPRPVRGLSFRPRGLLRSANVRVPTRKPSPGGPHRLCRESLYGGRFPVASHDGARQWRCRATSVKFYYALADVEASGRGYERHGGAISLQLSAVSQNLLVIGLASQPMAETLTVESFTA